MDQENETRKLIKYLNLKWEKACLAPQDNERSVLTSSNTQICQKVYQGSSKEWKKIEPYLNKVFRHL